MSTVTIPLSLLVFLFVIVFALAAAALIQLKLANELRNKKFDLEVTIRKILETVRENHGIEIHISQETVHVITEIKEKK